MNIASHAITITTDDNHALAGLMIRPEGEVRAACVVHGATGVPKEFYSRFAGWLAAERGVATLIYDYRDFAGSLKGHIKDSTASMSDWGIKDQSAALDHLIAQYQDKEIWAIGHSLGGLFLNAHSQSSRVNRAFAVAAGQNYWRESPLIFMPVILCMWWIIGPVATKLAGYFPGKYMGLGSNLPGNVYWQWRKWCTTPGFFESELEAMLDSRKLVSPQNIRVIAMTDDLLITPPMAKRLIGYYKGVAPVDFRQIDPREIGSRKIGHINIFRESNKKAWELIIS